jgi:ferric-dicitrate binding protein FerR (iron transport regulator)
VDHLASVGKRRKRALPIVLGFLAVVAIVLLLFVFPALRRDAIGEAFASPDTRSIFTKQGQLAAVKLSDGTDTKLGAASRIVIPPHFTTRLRAVQLDGSASFTVAANPLPFIVRAGRATITATGTTFDVSAYAAEPKVFIRVREGSVRVRTGRTERVLAAPGTVVVDASGNPAAPIADEGAVEALGWIDGTFTLKDRSLRDALPMIRRWYDLDLTTAEPSLLERRVTLQAGLDSSQAVVRALLANANLALEYQGKRAVLKNAAPPVGKR